MLEVGELAKDLVVTRTKKGMGVKKSEGKQAKLKGLSESYKKQRNRLRRQGKLANDTSPSESNLTKEGQMLQSVDSRAAKSVAEVYIKGQDNNKKAELQEKAGRTFMNLSKTEVNKIKKLIEQKIKADIKKKGL